MGFVTTVGSLLLIYAMIGAFLWVGALLSDSDNPNEPT
jgi:hypothetical protein